MNRYDYYAEVFILFVDFMVRDGCRHGLLLVFQNKTNDRASELVIMMAAGQRQP